MAAIRASSIGAYAAGLAWVGVRAFLGTACVVMLGGMALAGAAYWFVRDAHYSHAVLAVALVLVESAAIAAALGWKHAVAATVTHGLGSLRLGRSLVRLVFDRVSASVAQADADGGLALAADGLRRLPLARTQQLVDGAIRSLADDGHGGWTRRQVRRWLFRVVRKYTLAQFREAETEHGGIDLLAVRTQVEETIDGAIVHRLRKGLWLLTILTAVGFPLLVAVQTWAIAMLPRLAGP